MTSRESIRYEFEYSSFWHGAQMNPRPQRAFLGPSLLLFGRWSCCECSRRAGGHIWRFPGYSKHPGIFCHLIFPVHCRAIPHTCTQMPTPNLTLGQQKQHDFSGKQKMQHGVWLNLNDLKRALFRLRVSEVNRTEDPLSNLSIFCKKKKKFLCVGSFLRHDRGKVCVKWMFQVEASRQTLPHSMAASCPGFTITSCSHRFDHWGVATIVLNPQGRVSPRILLGILTSVPAGMAWNADI